MDYFLQYSNIDIIDGTQHGTQHGNQHETQHGNQHETQLKDNFFEFNVNDCLNACTLENNCQGLNITNPYCNSEQETMAQCASQFKSTSINNINLENNNPYKYNCKILKNINSTNSLTHSENVNSYIKNKYTSQFEKITGSAFYLETNGKYLGIEEKFDNLFVVSVPDKKFASKFIFGPDNNIIESTSKKCLKTNGEYIILADCVQDDPAQKFIYENKFNTIRPTDIEDLNIVNGTVCLSLSLNTQPNTENYPNDNRIVLEKCINAEKQRINYESDTDSQTDTTKENFFTSIKLDPIDDPIDDPSDLVPNINFCSNPVYKTIVTLILVGIIIYFIWFVTRKKYWDDESLFETSSTPFNTPINY